MLLSSICQLLLPRTHTSHLTPHTCKHTRRALSLPAALSINVSQAAFRSMLDLTTPFCIVMTVNAANYLLNQLLMVIFPYGMAGCGWASVISQVGYVGLLCV